MESGTGIKRVSNEEIAEFRHAARDVGFRDDVMPPIMKDNAAKLLRLQ